jgi:hypothetical protein
MTILGMLLGGFMVFGSMFFKEGSNIGDPLMGFGLLIGLASFALGHK